MNPTSIRSATGPRPRRRCRDAKPPALLLALAAMLAGCVSIGDSPELTVYAPAIGIEVDAGWPRSDRSIAIAEPHASTALDSNRIAVRPTPATLQVYAGAIWSDTAPALVQSTLVDAFAASGRFPAVLRPTDGIGADLLLRLDLRHFEAVYADGGRPPSVVVELQATLVDQRGYRVLASRRFHAEQAAERARLEQVVPAFEDALAEVATAMIPWALAEAAER